MQTDSEDEDVVSASLRGTVESAGILFTQEGSGGAYSRHSSKSSSSSCGSAE